MTDQHPITPLLELVQQWSDSSPIQHSDESWAYELFIADQAAQWGADQELEACCALIDDWGLDEADLRAARRPKPLSLKEQALTALDDAVMRGDCITISDALPTLRRALEALND